MRNSTSSDAGRNYKDPSAAAVHAARAIMRNFRLDTLPPPQKSKWAPTERNVAIIIDVCTQVFRLEHTVNTVCRELDIQNPHSLQRNTEQVREALFLIERARNFLPQYTDTNVVVEEQNERFQDSGARSLK